MSSADQAGPSTSTSSATLEPKLKSKTKSSHRTLTKRTKLPPPLPPRPTTSSHPSASIHPRGKAPSLPYKTLQGVSKNRTDGTGCKEGFGREVVFVTRRTGLGMLMGRCRSLVVDEGYTKLTLHALGAAIPQALLLLHALMDLLPYPVGEKGMWYEIRTGSVECVDEVEDLASASGATAVAGADADGEDDMAWLDDVGRVEADVPKRESRIKSSISIDLHISPKPKSRTNQATPVEPKGKGRNRPSKKRRDALAARRKQTRAEGVETNEEEAMNMDMDAEEMHIRASGMTMSEEEEVEEIELDRV